MLSVLLILVAFGTFVGLYFVTHRDAGIAKMSLVPRKRGGATSIRKQMIHVWVFTLAVLPIILFQAKTTWLVRCVVGIAFLVLLGLGTAWMSSGHD